MRRRVLLYDAGSPAATSAAALLADDFDVRVWAPPETTEAVVLTSNPAAVPGDRLRLIGVVESSWTAPRPASWYGLIAAGAGRAIVAATVGNAFTDLDASAERDRLERELGELNAIGIQLSAEHDLDVLLETILTKAREITRSDAGSLYL